MSPAICPLCRQQAAFLPPDETASQGYECKICGRFRLTHPTMQTLQGLHAKDRRLAGLSAFVNAANRTGVLPTIKTTDWESLAAAHSRTPVSEKLRRLLSYLAEVSERPGSKITVLGDQIYPLLDAANSAEVGFLLQTLEERGDIVPNPGGSKTITARGWERLDPVVARSVPGVCFVAMSFKADLDIAFSEGIQKAIEEDCGFSGLRVDRVEHAENINDKILADIRSAQFVVADFTHHPNGVYFEAGFALGLGKLVIWTCRKSDFDQAHFDTKPYNHILWDEPSHLRSQLTNRIRALVPGAKLG